MTIKKRLSQSHVCAFRRLFKHPHGGELAAQTRPVPTHTAYNNVLFAGIRMPWLTHVELTDTMELNR